MKRLVLILLLALAATLTAWSQALAAPQSNLTQSLYDASKIVDSQERLAKFDEIAKLLKPERLTVNPWTIKVSVDKAIDTSYYTMSAPMLDYSGDIYNMPNIVIYFIKSPDSSESKCAVFYAQTDSFMLLTVNEKYDQKWNIVYKYENGDKSSDIWSFTKGSSGLSFCAYSLFPGKVMNEISVHDTMLFSSSIGNYKFNIKGLAVALAKYNISIDELIKAAANTTMK
jgi:hypothetical protein